MNSNWVNKLVIPREKTKEIEATIILLWTKTTFAYHIVMSELLFARSL